MPQPGETPVPKPDGDQSKESSRNEAAGRPLPDGPGGLARPATGPETVPETGQQPGRRRRRLGLAAAVVAVVAVAGAAPFAWQQLGGSQEGKPRQDALSGPAKTTPAADFDDDGLQDTYATGDSGGGVSVVYGHKSGPDADSEKDGGSDEGDFRKEGAKQGQDGEAPEGERRQRIDLDSPGVPEKEQLGVAFGEHAVARDIDKDGYTDLVASLKSYRKDPRSGLIALWGSPKGLSGGTYLQGTPGDYLSSNGGRDDPLVAGDFTGDGHTDLVVRTGSERGLLKGPFSREGKPAERAAVPDPFPEAGAGAEFLGAYAGDLNGDGTDDLIDTHATADDGVGGGRVESAYMAGGDDGFAEPDTSRLPGIASATTGDVDKDGYADVVLRRFSKGSAPDSGVDGPVEVFHGSEEGPDPERRTEIDQDSPGVPGEKTGSFGDALDAGDANGDGYADVAVGAGRSLRDEGRSSVTVLRGGPEGLTGRGARVVEEPSSSPEPAPEDGRTVGNVFGGAVRLADTDGDGKGDLAVGAPVTNTYEGALWIFPAEKDGWPEDAARSYGPRDFGGPDVPDDDQLGANVG